MDKQICYRRAVLGTKRAFHHQSDTESRMTSCRSSHQIMATCNELRDDPAECQSSVAAPIGRVLAHSRSPISVEWHATLLTCFTRCEFKQPTCIVKKNDQKDFNTVAHLLSQPSPGAFYCCCSSRTGADSLSILKALHDTFTYSCNDC